MLGDKKREMLKIFNLSRYGLVMDYIKEILAVWCVLLSGVWMGAS
jgi:hypothetical protein